MFSWSKILKKISSIGGDFVGKKDNNIVVYSPILGDVVPLTEIPDEAFSKKFVGDGVGLVPKGEFILSPIKGKIISVAPHAFVIRHEDSGLEFLVHIGLDSVTLSGRGFRLLVALGATVDVGEEIVQVDFNEIENLIPSTDVIVLCSSMSKIGKVRPLVPAGNSVEAGASLLAVDAT